MAAGRWGNEFEKVQNFQNQNPIINFENCPYACFSNIVYKSSILLLTIPRGILLYVKARARMNTFLAKRCSTFSSLSTINFLLGKKTQVPYSRIEQKSFVRFN